MILHVDMDYFFAQAEEERNPLYKNKVVVVCVYSGRTKDSGVVSTVNYEGRRYGIYSSMPIFEAKKRAPPDSVFLPVDRGYYGEISTTVDDTIRKYSDKVEKTSIDEWYLEVAQLPEENAAALKAEIREKTGLTCTIGVAPSKLGAKMAVAQAKPDGIEVFDVLSEKEFIDDSPVEKVPGIGKQTKEALNALGVRVVKDLAAVDTLRLNEIFGKRAGAWLFALANGMYANKIEEETEQTEVSRIATLKEATRDPYMLMAKIKELEKEPRAWLGERKKFFRTIGIIAITSDMKTHSKTLSFRKPKDWNENIDDELNALVKDFLKENSVLVRRVGIRFSNLLDAGGQTTLF